MQAAQHIGTAALISQTGIALLTAMSRRRFVHHGRLLIVCLGFTVAVVAVLRLARIHGVLTSEEITYAGGVLYPIAALAFIVGEHWLDLVHYVTNGDGKPAYENPRD